MKLNISYPHEIDELIVKIREEINKMIESTPAIVEYKIRSDKNYTEKQRAALHVWCREMAKTLNDAGLYQVKLKAMGKCFNRDMFKGYSDPDSLLDAIDSYFKHSYIIKPWSGEDIKEAIWKPVLKAETGKKSTELQKTNEPNIILKIIRTHFWESHQLSIPDWPANI